MQIVPTLAAVVMAAVAEPAVSATPAPRDQEVEIVKIETRDGQALRASFLAPSKSKSAALAPGALLVHGAGGDRNELEAIAQRLHKQGFGVLVLDLRGHGDSVNAKYDWSGSDEKARESLWTFALRDLEAGADYLLSDRRIHSTSLGVVGHGTGCMLAARYAGRDENVRAVALLDPKTEALGFDLAADVAELAGLPTMIAVTGDDQEIGQALGEAGKAANGGREFVELSVMRKCDASVLEDKRLPAQLAKWLADEAMPRRARG